MIHPYYVVYNLEMMNICCKKRDFSQHYFSIIITFFLSLSQVSCIEVICTNMQVYSYLPFIYWGCVVNKVFHERVNKT